MEPLDPFHCEVCGELYNTKSRKPKLLPSCGHTFCLVCLLNAEASKLESKTEDSSMTKPRDDTRTVSDSKRVAESSFTCLACRTPYAISAVSLPTNYSLLQNMPSISSSSPPKMTVTTCCKCTKTKRIAVNVCLVCNEFLCEFHSEEHSEDHALSYLSQTSSVSKFKMCKTHPKQEFDMYCNDCHEVVCLKCCVMSHNGHDCTDINTAVINHQSIISSTQSRCEDMIRDTIGIGNVLRESSIN